MGHFMKVAILHAMETEPDLFSSFFKAVSAPFGCQVFEITKGEYPDSSSVLMLSSFPGAKKECTTPILG